MEIRPSARSRLMSSENLAICLTDAPGVVRLKREFYALDSREEVLKAVGHPAVRAGYAAELASVRRRKAEIARAIFGAGVLHGLH